jgi:hypothetical protein
MSESFVAGLQKLSIRPGDILAVTMPESCTMTIECVHAWQTWISERLPAGSSAMILPAGWSLAIVRNDVVVEPECDAPVTVPVEAP